MSRRGRRGRAGWNTLAAGIFVVMVFPVFWMISTAFKSDDEIVSYTPTWFSLHPTIAHFRALWANEGLDTFPQRRRAPPIQGPQRLLQIRGLHLGQLLEELVAVQPLLRHGSTLSNRPSHPSARS